MAPICTVMVYRNRLARRLDIAVRRPLELAGTGPIPALTLPRLLPQPLTLIRDLDCIRAGGGYFALIKADRATPHPPTPRRPVR
jgi:hypothetical protein